MNTEGTNLVPFKIFAVDQLLGASQEAVAARKQAAVAGAEGIPQTGTKSCVGAGRMPNEDLIAFDFFEMKFK